MNESEKTKARNVERIKSVINGDVESVTVAGVMICRIDVRGAKYSFSSGRMSAYGDELEISKHGVSVYLLQDGMMISSVYLGDYGE